MELEKFISSQLKMTSLSQHEAETITGGGENVFYDAGVAVGRGIVRACRWWESYCNRHADNIFAS